MIARTFYNSRQERIYWNYTDTNNVMFTIMLKNRQECNFIFRYLNIKDEKLKKFKNIIKRLAVKKYGNNIAETSFSKLSFYEYNYLRTIQTEHIIKLCAS